MDKGGVESKWWDMDEGERGVRGKGGERREGRVKICGR